MEKLGIWAIAIATVFFAGSIFSENIAFADDDYDDKNHYGKDYDYKNHYGKNYDDKNHDDGNKDKTLESECAKKLNKRNLNLDGLFCQAIIAIQDMLDMVKAIVADHETRITDIENQQGGASIYTLSESHDVPDGTTLTVTLFCDDRDTVINGYFQAPDGINLENRNSYSIITDAAEGFRIAVLNFENTPQNVNFVVVCQKTA